MITSIISQNGTPMTPIFKRGFSQISSVLCAPSPEHQLNYGITEPRNNRITKSQLSTTRTMVTTNNDNLTTKGHKGLHNPDLIGTQSLFRQIPSASRPSLHETDEGGFRGARGVSFFHAKMRKETAKPRKGFRLHIHEYCDQYRRNTCPSLPAVRQFRQAVRRVLRLLQLYFKSVSLNTTIN